MEYSNDNQSNRPTNETISVEQNPGGVQPKTPNHNLKIIIGVLIVLLVASVGVAGFFIYKNKTVSKNEQTTPTGSSITTPEPTTSKPAEQAVNYSVVVKENTNDKTKTDVFLKNPKTGQETFYITHSDIVRNRYHNAEYHNGNLYIIHRTGGDNGYQTNPNWTDELWRYNQQKQGQKLYSVRGLGFRVSDDEKMIAIVTNEEFNLLNNGGGKIKTFQSSEVVANPQNRRSGPHLFGFLAWGANSIWLVNTFGPSLAGLAKIDTQTYSVTKHDLSGLPAGPEFTINVYKEKIAFSNYPAMFDVEGAQEYERSGAKVNLMVYDLKTKTQQQIATSITKEFEPKWSDENILEYNNPNGAGRLTKQIP